MVEIDILYSTLNEIVLNFTIPGDVCETKYKFLTITIEFATDFLYPFEVVFYMKIIRQNDRVVSPDNGAYT